MGSNPTRRTGCAPVSRLCLASHLVEKRRLISHAEAAQVLRHAGYSHDQIRELLRDLPDPIDPERDGSALFELGLTAEKLMDRMGGSP